MAIQFARIEYVSRSMGGNACRKAAYNERSRITCERTGEVFNWNSKSDLFHHEILLPEGVSQKFKDSSYLWNAAEHAERRKDSQVAKESVIALPDDKIITHEDRIELTRRYAHALFVSKGLGVQVDIHAPHDGENNWHAHLLVTTRAFSKDGASLAAFKARETDPSIRKGYIKKEQNPGDIWAQIQNSYFKEKGYNLEVEATSLVAQIHMGPVRMRGHLTDVIARAELLKQANEEAVRNPGEIIRKLTEKSSVFSEKDVDRLLEKFVEATDRDVLRDKIFAHKSIITLYDKHSQSDIGLFTTKQVRTEEEKLLRFAARVNEVGVKRIKPQIADNLATEKGLSSEQEAAVKHALFETEGLAIVQGRAGTGKSYTMNAVREGYERSGANVRGLAPTHLVAGDMEKDGFQSASTVHKFLFDIKNGKASIAKNSVLMIDEAGMIGNSVFVELLHAAKEKNAKIVLFGDSKQLSAVERGGMLESLVTTYGSATLKEVRRQKVDWQKNVSEQLGDGAYRQAIQTLNEAKVIDWQKTKEESMASLVSAWTQSYEKQPEKSRLILANKNTDVDALNRAIREIRLIKGDIDALGYEIQTQRGREVFSKGDRVTFTLTDKDVGIKSGSLGTISKLDEKTCVVKLDNGQELTLDPNKYQGLKLGYASTIYKSQGKTINEVYVLHDKSSNQKLSYVALSRQSETLKVFVNTDDTRSLNHLVSQVSRDPRKISSLEFMTADQLNKVAQNQNAPLSKIADKLNDVVTSIKDKFHRNDEFYQLKPLESSIHPEPVKTELSIDGLFKQQADRQMQQATGKSLGEFEKAMAQFMEKYGRDGTASVTSTIETQTTELLKEYDTYSKALTANHLTPSQKADFEKTVAEFAKNTSAMTYLTQINPEVKRDIDRMIGSKEQTIIPPLNKNIDVSR